MQARHAAIGAALVAVAFVAGALGCSGAPDTGPAAKAERRKARADRIAADLAQPVRTHRWAVGEHELLLIEAPASNGTTVVRKQCFVWRDAQFRTATMSCTEETDDTAPVAER